MPSETAASILACSIHNFTNALRGVCIVNADELPGLPELAGLVCVAGRNDIGKDDAAVLG